MGRGARPVEGEEAIIQGFLAPLAAGYPGAFGLVDDAAAITPPPGQDVVVTVDAVAEGIHFFADDAAGAIGWKALAVNVSDLAAKGAAPHAYVMSLAFPAVPDRAWLQAFASGLDEAQQLFGLALIGGDTDRRPGPLAVTITAFGLVPTGRMVRRGSARPGERIYVTGTLGDSALGLRLRRGDEGANLWPLGRQERDHLVGRYLRPRPRVALAAALREHASAAMDISDGLLKDLRRMAAASRTGALIEAARLPLSAAAAQVPAAIALEAAASGGDDYEILATVPRALAAAFESGARAAGVLVTDIGEIVAENVAQGVVLTGTDGRPVAIGRTGYDHF